MGHRGVVIRARSLLLEALHLLAVRADPASPGSQQWRRIGAQRIVEGVKAAIGEKLRHGQVLPGAPSAARPSSGSDSGVGGASSVTMKIAYSIGRPNRRNPSSAACPVS